MSKKIPVFALLAVVLSVPVFAGDPDRTSPRVREAPTIVRIVKFIKKFAVSVNYEISIPNPAPTPKP